MFDRMLRIALALLVPTLLAGAGCKKQAPPADNAPPPVQVRLQVTSVSPSTVTPQTVTPANVYGSAFEAGAGVAFLGAAGERLVGGSVRVDSSNTISLTIPALSAGVYDVIVTNATGESSTLRGGLQVKAANDCQKVVVYFDLDSSTIRPDAKSTLEQQMSCLQSVPGNIRVEGHCDERGTVDYNSLLGQRRAESVKRYLVSNGVNASRVNTVSYGEERPADSRHNEAAWARNRRDEILVSE